MISSQAQADNSMGYVRILARAVSNPPAGTGPRITLTVFDDINDMPFTTVTVSYLRSTQTGGR